MKLVAFRAFPVPVDVNVVGMDLGLAMGGGNGTIFGEKAVAPLLVVDANDLKLAWEVAEVYAALAFNQGDCCVLFKNAAVPLVAFIGNAANGCTVVVVALAIMGSIGTLATLSVCGSSLCNETESLNTGSCPAAGDTSLLPSIGLITSGALRAVASKFAGAFASAVVVVSTDGVAAVVKGGSSACE